MDMMFFGFTQLFAFFPGKFQIAFLSLFFLGQGAIGPVDPNMIPNNADVVINNNSYFQTELAEYLPYNTYAYGFINRLDIGSQNFMTTPVGRKLAKVSLPKLLSIFEREMRGKKPLVELKKVLNEELNLKAQDIYALTQAKIEVALTNYESKVTDENILIAYFPKTEASKKAFKKVIDVMVEKMKGQVEESDTRLYKQWKIPFPIDTKMILAGFKDKPFYLIALSQSAFDRFIKDYQNKPKYSLADHLKRTGIIQKMGRGAYFGAYSSAKGIVKESATVKDLGEKEIEKVYNAFGIKTVIISDSYHKDNYRNRVDFIYDEKEKSIMKKLTPMGFSSKDFSWVPSDTRLMWALSLKELPEITDVIGEMVSRVAGKREYEEYNRELKKAEEELKVNVKDLLSVLTGKVFVALNADDNYLENTLVSLDHRVGDFVGLSVLKKVIVGLSVKSQKETQQAIKDILKAIPFRGQTPIVERSDIAFQSYKVMFNLYDDYPVSLYWTYIDDKVIFTLSEDNMRKVVQASKGYKNFASKMGIQQAPEVLSYLWHDNRFLTMQLAYGYELALASLKQKYFNRYKGKYQYKVLVPLARTIGKSMGSGLSYTKITKEGVSTLSISPSGFSVGDMLLPVAGALAGLVLFRGSMATKQDIMVEPVMPETKSESKKWDKKAEPKP